MQEQIALEVVTLPCEKNQKPLPPKPVYNCLACAKIFHRPCELAGHVLWKHPSHPRSTVCVPARQFRGKLSASLAYDQDGGVRLTICINGKDRAQVLREAEENERANEAAKAERERESTARRIRLQRERDAEAAPPEQRRGSAHRHQYGFPEKARLLNILDGIDADGTTKNKSAAFESDSRTRGCPYTTAFKWKSMCAADDSNLCHVSSPRRAHVSSPRLALPSSSPPA
jgi:hypothetical protein